MSKLNGKRSRLWGALIAAAILLSASHTWAANTTTSQLTQRLFKAVAANNMASVRSSITAGASITVVNPEGLTAAGLAIEKGYFTIAHYILGVRNQRTSGDERSNQNAVNSALPELPKGSAINIPQRRVMLPPQTAPDQKPPAQAAKQWPANKPNPFAPNIQSGSMPIIGALQKPTVQPALPKKTIRSDLKEQTPDIAPLKTANTPALRQTQAPTQITPLSKNIVIGMPNTGTNGPGDNNKGIMDRMVDGVTGVFKSEDETPRPPLSPVSSKAKTSEQDDDTEDGVIGRMWNSITNIF